MCGEKDWWWKLGCQMIGQIEVDVEAPQVAAFLPADFINLAVWEYLPARCMLDMRQRQETNWQQPTLADLVRAHVRERVPGCPGRQLYANAVLHRLASAAHH